MSYCCFVFDFALFNINRRPKLLLLWYQGKMQAVQNTSQRPEIIEKSQSPEMERKSLKGTERMGGQRGIERGEREAED